MPIMTKPPYIDAPVANPIGIFLLFGMMKNQAGDY